MTKLTNVFPLQILTDYQGFLDEFHGRSLRHVVGKSNEKNNYDNGADRHRYNSNKTIRTNVRTNGHHENKYNNNIEPITSNISYTNLTIIPETEFSCRGRKGMFADVETKCQVSSLDVLNAFTFNLNAQIFDD